MKKRGLSNSIVFYDLAERQPDLKGWYFTIKAYDQTPTRMGITAPFVKVKKTLSFKNGNKKLIDNDFKEVGSISLYANIINHDLDMSDFNFGESVELTVSGVKNEDQS
jgi:hypothetical protein